MQEEAAPPGSPDAPTDSDALTDLLKRAGLASTALVVGIFDETGQVLGSNAGMRELLCEPCRGERCVDQFINPTFAALWQRGGQDHGFTGHLSIGDGKRVNRSIKVHARRRDGYLEVAGELDAAEIERNNAELIELNRTITDLEHELLRKNRWLETSLETITRKERLNAALAEINEAIRTCADEPTLFAALCEISVRRGQFKFARISRPDAGGVFQSLAADGETAFLGHLRIQLDPKVPEGQTLTARAFRSGTEQVSNNFQADPTTALLHEQARRHAIAAAAAIPIRSDAGPDAVLSVYADAIGFFGDDELQLLLKIAADVGFAVTALRQRQALRQSESRYRQIFDHAPLGLLHYDPSGNVIDCNDAYVEIVGSSHDKVMEINLLRDLKDQRVVDAVRESLVCGESNIELPYRSVTADKVTPIRAFFAAIRDASGTVESGIGVVEDFSARRALEDRLRLSEERFRLAVYAAAIGVWEYYPQRHRLTWDARMCQLHGRALGRAPKDFAGWRRLMHPEDRVAVVRRFWGAMRSKAMLSQVVRVVRPDGELRSLQLFARAVAGQTGQVQRITGVCFDVTEQQRAEEEIRKLAFYDPLTNLANRRLLVDRLRHAFARAERQGSHGTLLLLDLDGFKRVNDTQGHDAGDELLVELARRLQGELRRVDTVARLGGDEFVVLGEGLDAAPETAMQEANALAVKVAALARRPYTLPSVAGSLFHCAASVGVALFDGRSSTPNEAMKQADIAMFEAKRAGRNRIRTFQPEMQSALVHQAARTELLHHALDTDQLKLRYQPQLDADGRWFGCEVTLDWKRDNGRRESPMELLAGEESSELIKDVDDWILQHVMDHYSRLCACRGGRLWIGIPISAQKFSDPTFVEQTLGVLECASFDQCAVRFEIKEHILFADLARSAHTLARLGAAGVGVGLRTLSSGVSALPLAQRLPVQTIKIGAEITRCCTDDPSARALVRAAIATGRALDVPVIAEGIERKQQYKTLLAEGCKIFQGDYLEPPMSIDVFARRVSEAVLCSP